MVGLANDTNLIVYNSDVTMNCECLEYVWVMYERWAVIRGMAFALEKSELMHFTRVYTLSKQMVRFLSVDMAPVESARFFRIWLDQKLR